MAGRTASAAGGRNARIGRRGEQVAAGYLGERGYRVLERNWRSREPGHPGELDLVLRHRGTLVICEVKTRTGDRLAHPAEAVTGEKAARLRRLAALWVREQDRGGGSRRRGRRYGTRAGAYAPAKTQSVRIDVVAVRLGPREPFPVLSVEHLPGVA
jgi:putative endonuclease